MPLHVRRLLVLLCILAGAGCSSGPGGAASFAGLPNNGGGTSGGTVQAGGTRAALLRFVQGSPDYGGIDVCIDNLPFNLTAPTVMYGNASANVYSIAGGITHTIAVYPSLGSQPANAPGAQCPTAPGPYFGTAPIAVTTLAPAVGANAARQTIVFAGTAASKTLGLYVFGEPMLTPVPAANTVISHNAAPAFSSKAANGVGFGYVPSGGTPTTLAGASNVGAATISSSSSSSVINGTVQSTIPAVPASFYDGAGVSSGTVVPVATVSAPTPTASPYVVDLYAIDASGGGLRLVAVQEQAVGLGL